MFLFIGERWHEKKTLLHATNGRSSCTSARHMPRILTCYVRATLSSVCSKLVDRIFPRQEFNIQHELFEYTYSYKKSYNESSVKADTMNFCIRGGPGPPAPRSMITPLCNYEYVMTWTLPMLVFPSTISNNDTFLHKLSMTKEMRGRGICRRNQWDQWDHADARWRRADGQKTGEKQSRMDWPVACNGP